MRSDTATIPNIRLLDPSMLSTTFTQLQQRKNFYGFPDKLDIDRYAVNGKIQDYIVAAREIDSSALTGNQTDWINRHMVYTHGNGFVAAPANQVNAALRGRPADQGGLPGSPSATSTDARADIPVDQPRIYYGELITDYAIVGAQDGAPPREYDTDAAERTPTTAPAACRSAAWFNRLVFARHYGERNILFYSAIGDNAKIMYNRDPRDRVQAVAPWLTVDGDPYPAVVDGQITVDRRRLHHAGELPVRAAQLAR